MGQDIDRLTQVADAVIGTDEALDAQRAAERPGAPNRRASSDPARFYRPDVFHRLRAVKAAYDPDDLFRANHPIPPAR